MSPIVQPPRPPLQSDASRPTALTSYSYNLQRHRQLQDQKNHSPPSIKITNYTSRNLFFEERNKCGSETVVLLHELYGCHLEFKWVKLTGTGNGNSGGGLGINGDKDAWGFSVGNGYHVLIPDLPGHSLSRELLWSHPAEFEKQESKSEAAHTASPSILRITCEHLHHLICQHAKRQRAHLVGIGYGAYIALQMAKLFPTSVSCVVAITTSSLSLTSTPTINQTPLNRHLSFFTPYLSYASLKPILTIPGLYRWIIEEGRTGIVGGTAEKIPGRRARGKLHKGVKLPEGLTEEMWANTRLELAKKVHHSLKVEFDFSSIIQAIMSRNNSKGGIASWGDGGYWKTSANGDGGGMNLDWYGKKKRTLLVIGNDEEWAELRKSKDLGSLLTGDAKVGENNTNEGRLMITTRGMGHAWNLHEPEVFARMVEGWIQDGEEGLPSELVGWKAWADEKKQA